MLNYFLKLDERLFLFLNGLNTPWLDSLMYLLTDEKIWTPLFLFTFLFILIKFRQKGLFILFLVFIAIVLGDQLSSGVLKPLIGRIRPSHEPHLESVIHIVNNYKGGLYSFVSSHATNSFGVATLLWLLIGHRYKWIFIFFCWAIIFSYTRVYLGVHYPIDILSGAILGVSIALCINWVCRKYSPQIIP